MSERDILENDTRFWSQVVYSICAFLVAVILGVLLSVYIDVLNPIAPFVIVPIILGLVAGPIWCYGHDPKRKKPITAGSWMDDCSDDEPEDC